MTPFTTLRAVVKVYKSQRQAALALGISESLLSDVLSGHRPISRRMAEKLGYRREVVFRKTGAARAAR